MRPARRCHGHDLGLFRARASAGGRLCRPCRRARAPRGAALMTAALSCRTKIKKARFLDRNRPVSWVELR
jgi:hypothetical protein